MIISRMTRVRENQNDEAAKQKVTDDLNKCLSEYQGKYNRAKVELEKLNETFEKQMKDLQKQIDIIREQIDEINKTEFDTQNMTGLQGKTLIDCLTAVEKYGVKITGGAAYAPLISILEGIKAMVEIDIQLLSSPNRLNIFTAGSRLLNQVQFLSSYSVSCNRILPPSAQYESIANAIE